MYNLPNLCRLRHSPYMPDKHHCLNNSLYYIACTNIWLYHRKPPYYILRNLTEQMSLYNLPNLKRIWAGDIDELKQSTIDKFLTHHPDLEAYNFTTKYPTMFGWRENYRYEVVKAMFKERVYYPFDYELKDEQYVNLFKNTGLMLPRREEQA